MTGAEITFALMADTMEVDVIGKRQRIEQCRKNARWPASDIAAKEEALPVFEEIARRLRVQANREGQGEAR